MGGCAGSFLLAARRCAIGRTCSNDQRRQSIYWRGWWYALCLPCQGARLPRADGGGNGEQQPWWARWHMRNGDSDGRGHVVSACDLRPRTYALAHRAAVHVRNPQHAPHWRLDPVAGINNVE